MAQRNHQVRPTLLAVGEGGSEHAFLKHLRSLYCAKACKRTIQQEIGVDLTEAQSYAIHFTKSVLDQERGRLPELDKLIKCFEGSGKDITPVARLRR